MKYKQTKHSTDTTGEATYEIVKKATNPYTTLCYLIVEYPRSTAGCGRFTAVNATMLLHGLDSQNTVLIQNQRRNHLFLYRLRKQSTFSTHLSKQYKLDFYLFSNEDKDTMKKMAVKQLTNKANRGHA